MIAGLPPYKNPYTELGGPTDEFDAQYVEFRKAVQPVFDAAVADGYDPCVIAHWFDTGLLASIVRIKAISAHLKERKVSDGE